MVKNLLTSRNLKKLFSNKETVVFLIIVVLSFLLSNISPHFFTTGNITTLLLGMSAEGIIVIGMTMVLVLGGIDLSVGSIMCLTCMLTAYLGDFGINVWVAALISLSIGVLCGLINGIFIAKIGLSAFITTLAMQGLAGGLTLLITEGRSLSMSNVPAFFSFFGSGKIGGLPVLVIIFLVLMVLGDILLRYSEPLRRVFYIGSNEKTAMLSGINVVKSKITVYMTSAFLASLAGILTFARFNSSTPTIGKGVELVAISAAVIGGASMNGGIGTVFGATLGLILLKLVSNGLILLNVSVYGQGFISGLILISAVTIDHLTNNRKKKI